MVTRPPKGETRIAIDAKCLTSVVGFFKNRIKKKIEEKSRK